MISYLYELNTNFTTCNFRLVTLVMYFTIHYFKFYILVEGSPSTNTLKDVL